MTNAVASTAAAGTGLPRVAPRADTPQAQRAFAAAREFEAVFIAQMLNSMTQGLGEKTGFDGGHAESQWKTMMNEHLARDVSRRGGFGIADNVMRELMRRQEIAR